MIMDLQEQLYVILHATPDVLVGWLHTFANRITDELSWPTLLIVGPHTFNAEEPLPFETLALYVVDSRKVHDIPARQVALAITYMPLSHPEIGLDLRVWPSFPAALDTLKYHFFDYFTQANPVLSSAAALYYEGNPQMLACTRWVLDKLATPAYADRKAAKQLYPAWIEQYRALKGDYPADPRRAFRTLLSQQQHHAASKRKPDEPQ